MNILVDSFILKSKDIIIRDLDNINKEDFVNVNDDIMKYKNQLDFDYLSGAIIIQYNETGIMGFREWDLIEQLWDYFIDAIDVFLKGTETEFQFPDQPLTVRFEQKNKDYMIFMLNEKKYTFLLKDFLQSILKSAITFYERLSYLFPENRSLFEDYLIKAKEIKSRI